MSNIFNKLLNSRLIKESYFDDLTDEDIDAVTDDRDVKKPYLSMEDYSKLFNRYEEYFTISFKIKCDSYKRSHRVFNNKSYAKAFKKLYVILDAASFIDDFSLVVDVFCYDNFSQILKTKDFAKIEDSLHYIDSETVFSNPDIIDETIKKVLFDESPNIARYEFNIIFNILFNHNNRSIDNFQTLRTEFLSIIKWGTMTKNIAEQIESQESPNISYRKRNEDAKNPPSFGGYLKYDSISNNQIFGLFRKMMGGWKDSDGNLLEYPGNDKWDSQADIIARTGIYNLTAKLCNIKTVYDFHLFGFFWNGSNTHIVLKYYNGNKHKSLNNISKIKEYIENIFDKMSDTEKGTMWNNNNYITINIICDSWTTELPKTPARRYLKGEPSFYYFMLDKNKTGDLPVTISIVDDSNKRRRFIDSKHTNASVDEYSIHDVLIDRCRDNLTSKQNDVKPLLNRIKDID